MAGPLSRDLRERVVAAVLAGESCSGAAVRFSVSASSAIKWSRRYRSTGSVAPDKMGGHRRPILDGIAQAPHLTLHGLKAELAERGVTVSHNAVWLFLKREGLSFKKSPVRA